MSFQRLHSLHRAYSKILFTLVLVPLGLTGCASLENLRLSTMSPSSMGGAYLTNVLATEDAIGTPSPTDGARSRLLPNETVLPGDNTLQYLDVSRISLRSHLSRSLGAIGSPPPPFEFVTPRDFRTMRDWEGDYHVAVAYPAEGTTCVLAVREIPFVGLERSVGTTGTTKVLRNCVRGSAQTALQPFLAQQPIFPAPF